MGVRSRRVIDFQHRQFHDCAARALRSVGNLKFAELEGQFVHGLSLGASAAGGQKSGVSRMAYGAADVVSQILRSSTLQIREKMHLEVKNPVSKF